MNPEARRLLQLARQARTPTASDKRRVRAALGFGVAATAASAPTGAAAAAVKALGIGARAGFVRVVVAALMVGSVGAGAFYSTRAVIHSRTQPRASAVAPAAIVAEVQSSPTTQQETIEAPPPAQDSVSIEGPPHAAPAPQDPLLAELTLLHRAQKAWQDGKPQLALDLVQKHSHMYPHSQLGLERDAVRVFALCALGRKAEASTFAAELLGKAPRSPLRTSLEESCAMRAPK